MKVLSKRFSFISIASAVRDFVHKLSCSNRLYKNSSFTLVVKSRWGGGGLGGVPVPRMYYDRPKRRKQS